VPIASMFKDLTLSAPARKKNDRATARPKKKPADVNGGLTFGQS
jgi:hypothetical protein